MRREQGWPRPREAGEQHAAPRRPVSAHVCRVLGDGLWHGGRHCTYLWCYPLGSQWWGVRHPEAPHPRSLDDTGPASATTGHEHGTQACGWPVEGPRQAAGVGSLWAWPCPARVSMSLPAGSPLPARTCSLGLGALPHLGSGAPTAKPGLGGRS